MRYLVHRIYIWPEDGARKKCPKSTRIIPWGAWMCSLHLIELRPIMDFFNPPDSGARGKVRRSPKIIRFVLWRQWASSEFHGNWQVHSGIPIDSSVCIDFTDQHTTPPFRQTTYSVTLVIFWPQKNLAVTRQKKTPSVGAGLKMLLFRWHQCSVKMFLDAPCRVTLHTDERKIYFMHIVKTFGAPFFCL